MGHGTWQAPWAGQRLIYESGVVGDMVDTDSLCDELDMASLSGETMGSGVLDVRGGDYCVCNARSDQVTLCECGQPLRTLDDGGHVRTLCCGRIIQGCCGD
jgi:hypothetical protein